MTKYIVQGGHPLFGEVHISGAKNAAVAIIPAALLVDGVCRIENIPQISDVTALLKILEQLGANVRFLNRSDVEIDCRHIATTQVSQELAHKIRASYYLIGALLGRFGNQVHIQVGNRLIAADVIYLFVGVVYQCILCIFSEVDYNRTRPARRCNIECP